MDNKLFQTYILVLILIVATFSIFYVLPIVTIKYLFDLAIYHSIQNLFNISLLLGFLGHALIFTMDRDLVLELKMKFFYKFLVITTGKTSLDIICGEGYEGFSNYIYNLIEEHKKKSKGISGDEDKNTDGEA